MYINTKANLLLFLLKIHSKNIKKLALVYEFLFLHHYNLKK